MALRLAPGSVCRLVTKLAATCKAVAAPLRDPARAVRAGEGRSALDLQVADDARRLVLRPALREKEVEGDFGKIHRGSDSLFEKLALRI